MSTASIPIVRPDDYTAPRHPGDLLSRRQRLVYVLVLGALTALGPFTIDLYLPAFPALEAELGVNAAAIQITLTGTMIGFGLGQLIVGPWSDKVGRRLPLMLSTALHIAASVAAERPRRKEFGDLALELVDVEGLVDAGAQPHP